MITRLQRPMGVILLLSLAVLGVANALLAPRFGLTGAAAAVGLATFFSAAALAVLLGHGTGLRADILAMR